MTKRKPPEEHLPKGRSTKYDPFFCEEARRFLSEGHSVAALAGRLGVVKSTVMLWASKYPDFSDALKEGQAGAVLWWEERLKAVAMGGDGNVTAVIFGLKNRASDEWRDKNETTVNAGDGLAELLASVAANGKRLGQD